MSRGRGGGRGCNRFPHDSAEKETSGVVPTDSHWRRGAAAAAGLESKGRDHGRQGRTSVWTHREEG